MANDLNGHIPAIRLITPARGLVGISLALTETGETVDIAIDDVSR